MLKPNMFMRSQEKNIYIAPNIVGVCSNFTPNQIVHLGFKRVGCAPQIKRVLRQKFVYFVVEAEKNSKGMPDNSVLSVNKGYISFGENVKAPITQSTGSAYVILESKESNANKVASSFVGLVFCEMSGIELQTIKRIMFKKSGDATDIFAVSASSKGKQDYPIELNIGVARGMTGKGKVNRVVPTKNFAVAYMSEDVPTIIFKPCPCICTNDNGIGETVNN